MTQRFKIYANFFTPLGFCKRFPDFVVLMWFYVKSDATGLAVWYIMNVKSRHFSFGDLRFGIIGGRERCTHICAQARWRHKLLQSNLQERKKRTNAANDTLIKWDVQMGKILHFAKH